MLQEADIPFTLHWGKNMDWGFPGLINHMYGLKAKEWKQHRSALLSEDMAHLFSNDFLETTGLAGIEENIPDGFSNSL